MPDTRHSEPGHSPCGRIHRDQNGVVPRIASVPQRITADDLTPHPMWPRQLARSMEDDCRTKMYANLGAWGDVRELIENDVIFVVAVREYASVEEAADVVM